MVQVSADVTAAHIKFLLLHDGRNEEAIKGFFRDVYEAYMRVRLTCSGSLCAGHLHHAHPETAVAYVPYTAALCAHKVSVAAGHDEPLLHADNPHQVGDLPAEGPHRQQSVLPVTAIRQSGWAPTGKAG